MSHTCYAAVLNIASNVFKMYADYVMEWRLIALQTGGGNSREKYILQPIFR